MQVVILCGGMGTRIRDIADDIPKPMIPIGGKPIVWHIMKSYSRFGFRRFVLCLGHKGWTLKRFFLDYHLHGADLTLDLGEESSCRIRGGHCQENWEVTLAETGLDTMTGARLKAVEPFIEGDNFLLTYGDGVSDIDVNDLLDFHRRHNRIGTVTAVHAPGRFGEMELDGPIVTDFSEKPPLTPGWISGGFFVFKREFLDLLSNDPGLILEREPLRQLARDGELAAYPHRGFWQCMDNSRDYQHLNQLWDEKKAVWLTPLAQDGTRAAA